MKTRQVIVQTIITLALALCGSSAAEARFFQTDPVGYKDDLNLYAYVGNDPANATDPMGSWTCQPCNSSQKGAFATSQKNAISSLKGKIAVLKALREAIASGARLNKSEKEAAAVMDKYLGGGAGGKTEAVDELISYAGAAMDAMRGQDAMGGGPIMNGLIADFHPGGGRGSPNSDTVSPSFFSMSDAARQQTMVHESMRAANFRLEGRDTMTGGGAFLHKDSPETISSFGADNIARIAGGGVYDPMSMIESFPDAATSALGFK